MARDTMRHRAISRLATIMRDEEGWGDGGTWAEDAAARILDALGLGQIDEDLIEALRDVAVVHSRVSEAVLGAQGSESESARRVGELANALDRYLSGEQGDE